MDLSLDLDAIFAKLPVYKVEGETELTSISGIASLKNAKRGDLSFLANPKYKAEVEHTNASFVLLPDDYTESKSKPGQLYIKTPKPSWALAKICRLIFGQLFSHNQKGVHPSAWIHESATLNEGVSVGPFCYVGPGARIGENTQLGSHCHVGENVSIGEDCILYPGVKLLALCELRNGVVLNAGVVVGSEGYGFDQVGGSHEKIPHLGKVIIEEDVEIGANSCIDRARLEETRIGAGTKIDNLVQIGHNVRIGKGCLLVAQVGIAGSVEFEDGVIVGGQAGFAGHLKVGKGARIAGQAGITKNVEPGAFLKGNPAVPVQLAHKISILQRKLPDLFKRFAQETDKK
ncbi:UDP-3-O-(3-hydroxymyristoyl)glucosamine N-acyltransferase [Opitutales bacterium]|nr:UDP-3-O-(3-hydroxymyristoyl)glucosamine N-acyltransferase [Opitutales bacterium]